MFILRIFILRDISNYYPEKHSSSQLISPTTALSLMTNFLGGVMQWSAECCIIIEHYISYNLWELAHLDQSQRKNSPNLYMKGKARVMVKLLLINNRLKV